MTDGAEAHAGGGADVDDAHGGGSGARDDVHGGETGAHGGGSGARDDTGRAALLRPLDAADLDRVTELEVELFGAGAWSRALYEEELTLPGRHYVAAVADGELVGYAGIALASDAQVMTVGVAEAHRRRGIATLLVADLVARARTARARQVFLEVRAGDGGAQELYRRAGFEPVGVRRRYYLPDGEDAVVMRRRLRSGAEPLGR